MNRNRWIAVIVALIVVAGGAFWGGMTYAASKAPAVSSRFVVTGAAGFAGRGSAGGGGTIGTVVQIGNGSFTVQLPPSTSTAATTGTKIVLVDNATQIQELASVPSSSIQVGQTVTVVGATNSDGSVTASSVMIRPATARASGAGATTQGSGQ